MEHRLLKTGMIFIDTPGLNTVINSHEAFTYEMLPYADYAIYVIGRGISAADCDVIAYLLKQGIDLTFVRAKIDTIKSSSLTFLIFIINPCIFKLYQSLYKNDVKPLVSYFVVKLEPKL